MSPAVTCACVNVVIATPELATSSNCPPVTLETVNSSELSTSSTSAADRFAPDRATVCRVRDRRRVVPQRRRIVLIRERDRRRFAGRPRASPSDTVTEYVGAASPPSCTNWMSPAVTCACVNVVIATPGIGHLFKLTARDAGHRELQRRCRHRRCPSPIRCSARLSTKV